MCSRFKILYFICFITLGAFYSCSKEDDNPNGGSYMLGGYRDGKYEGDRLNFIIDGVSADVTVDVKTTEDLMCFVVNGPSFSNSISLNAKYYEDASVCGYSPVNFVWVNGQVYKFEYSFDKESILSINCYAVSE